MIKWWISQIVQILMWCSSLHLVIIVFGLTILCFFISPFFNNEVPDGKDCDENVATDSVSGYHGVLIYLINIIPINHEKNPFFFFFSSLLPNFDVCWIWRSCLAIWSVSWTSFCVHWTFSLLYFYLWNSAY